jgi:CHAT domain-containing protein/Tfp pilus assembly protein PilF
MTAHTHPPQPCSPSRPISGRLLSVLLLLLLVALPPGAMADELDADALIEAVTAQLRGDDGAEPDAEAVVGALNGITVRLYGDGRYNKAAQIAAIALSQAERVLGDEHPDTLISVNNLAVLYRAQGRYGEAEPLYRRALEARERVLGDEHPDTLSSVNNLAGLYQAQGRYGEAEPLYRRALEALERVLGDEHPDTLSSVNNLAFLYQAQGRYGEAEPLYRRALEARERVLGDEHPDTLISVNNLAELYRAQGRYGEAEPLYRRALEALERVLGDEHPDTLISVNNLAALYRAQGRYGKAEPLYRRALEASERVLGDEHPDTLRSVNNLAALYYSQGRYGEAEPLYRRALEARERVLGDEHPDTLISVNNLAALYDSQGRYGEAEPLYRRALEARERVLGDEHPNTITMQLNLAITLINLDRLDPALAQLRVIETRLRRFVIAQLHSSESERVRRARLQQESRLQHIVFTLALEHPKSAAALLAADVLLRWKRLAGEEEATIARLARTSQDPRVLDLAGRIGQARSAFSRLANRADADPAERATQLAELGRWETELATLSRRFRGRLAGRDLEWERVQSELPRGAALVELRAYNPFDFKTGAYGKDRWLALVLARPGTNHAADAAADSDNLRIGPRPHFIDLGAVAATEPIRKALARLTREVLCLDMLIATTDDMTDLNAQAVKRWPPACARCWDSMLLNWPDAQRERLAAVRSKADASAAELYAKLFGPLDQALAEFETLVLAPDRALELVPFARLRLPDGRYWVQRQVLRQVGSGRDLLPLLPADEAVGMLALGDVDYEHFAAVASPDQANGSVVADSMEPSAWRALNARLRAARGGFEPLEQTAEEVATVGRYYWDYFGRKAEVVTGPDAGERRLRAIERPPRILHLATHGFFLDQSEAGALRPLTLAGLALAGANRGLDGKFGPGKQDGLLYALEVQDLNLEGTRLAVLSACDTGRGAVDSSEGVYGLVRAFRVAGAEQVLMSLWSVDDYLAAEFMGDFYRRWMGAGANADPALALRKTRLNWIGDRDPRRRNPAYWAPFVLVE